MESGLSVEDDEIPISNVTLHFVTTLQVEIRRLGMVPEIDTGAIVPDNVFSPWILVVSTLDQLHHPEEKSLDIIYTKK